MNSKIRIKLGAIEVDFEGTESFLKDELPSLLDAIAELHKKSKNLISKPDSNSDSAEDSGGSAGHDTSFKVTTGTVAAKLGVKSGAELIVAAAARRHLALGQTQSTRQQIIDEMKNASAYFKKSYVANLSNYLNTLVVSGSLLEQSKDTYAVSADALAQVRAKLG